MPCCVAEAVEPGRTKISAGEMEGGKGGRGRGRGSSPHSGKMRREGRSAMSDNSLEVPAAGPGGPHLGDERPPAFQRPQAHSCLQGPLSPHKLWAQLRVPQSVCCHVLCHLQQNSLVVPPAGPGNDACPSAHRLTPQEVTRGDFSLHCITTDIIP